ncbi:hypothetical protein L6R52_37180 [Myxococcota bacterium]|nr:hypothetical protein [Myxococcota bacterium]
MSSKFFNLQPAGWSCALLFAAITAPSAASAQTTTATTAMNTPPAETKTEAPKPAAKPAPYNIPFEMRPLPVVHAFRVDSTYGVFDGVAGSEPTLVSILNYSYPILPELAVIGRVGLLNGSGPASKLAGGGWSNPAIIAQYAPKIAQDFRLNAILGFTLPVGLGGGDDPDLARKNARNSALLTRSAMQNALFAVNDFAVVPGVGFAWVKYGLTLQIEATAIILTRVRGEMDQPDSSKINLTAGLHAGYFVAPWMSIGGELRMQRWLKEPKAVTDSPKKDDLMMTVTAAIGPRFHFKVGEKTWIRPAITYGFRLDDSATNAAGAVLPSDASYDVLQIDVPFIF